MILKMDVNETLGQLNNLHSQSSLMIHKRAHMSVNTCTQPCMSPSMESRIAVVVCVGLMECPRQKPLWDLMVRQTYSTAHIKINTQSEVFTLNAASFFKHAVLSMNIQHGQDLSSKDRSCPWDRSESSAKTRRKSREKKEKSVEGASSL